MELLSWGFSLLKPQSSMIECYDCEVVSAETLTESQILKSLAGNLNLPEEPIKEMLDWRDANNPDQKPRYWAVFDATKKSNVKRLHVFDIKAKIAKSYYVAHGKGSDPNHTGTIQKFSNEMGSNCTSKGLYLCKETYISTKFGLALRLDGLSQTNSKARARAVVFHGSTYAEDAFVKKNGKAGRSQGCPAVGYEYSSELINKLKNGSYLNIWTDQ